jgi:hypothetical protein
MMSRPGQLGAGVRADINPTITALARSLTGTASALLDSRAGTSVAAFIRWLSEIEDIRGRPRNLMQAERTLSFVRRITTHD